VTASAAREQPVYADGAYKPFGAFTRAEVQARADELRAATGWGPTARVAGVARAWAELGRAMDAAGAERVSDLDDAAVEEYGRRGWVVPPGGSLI
jgi:hypothetical protein